MFAEKYANKPLQFISINSFGKIVLHAEAVTVLRSLAPPISFASIIGPAKTGKSFLISQIISQSHSFNEQPTVGLWIWSKPILAYNQQGKIASIVLIDSQGFSMMEKEKEKTIISLVLLISNCLLYNSIGPIDSISFNELEQVMSIARELKDKNGEFHWILRDFDPSLVNKVGIYITSSQYMQNQLMEAQISYSEKTIQTLKQSFPNRSCHCFIKPTPLTLEQPPQFLKQIIQLRKCLNGVGSYNLDGNELKVIIESYIESLNSGDSVVKACQQGNDCRIRLQCLGKLGDELRQLEQKQSSNQIEDIEEHISEIRIHLKEYYKQRMCSHRQIQTLDEELNEIIEDFQEINDTQMPKSIQSREIIRLNVPKPQKMMRVSLNMSDCDKERLEFDSKPMISINKINTAKSLQSKLEDFQTKVYRYELEATCSKKQLQGLKDEYDRSRKQLQNKTDQIQSLLENTNQREKEYQNKIYLMSQQLQELRKQKIMVESELQKIKILNNEKITYLEEQIQELAELKQHQIQQKEEKYKSRINECNKEIQQLKKSHEEELAHLKKIYKDNQEQLIESKQNESNQTFYKEMREQMELLQKMKEEVERQRFAKNQILQSNKQLKKQLENKEDLYKELIQQQSKRAKQTERRLEQVHTAKLQSKTRIIEELQQKINEIMRTKEMNEQSTSQIIRQNDRLIAELEQKERKLTKLSTVSQQSNRELFRLKDSLLQYEQAIQVLTEQIKKKQEEIELMTTQTQKLQDLQKLNQAKITEKDRVVEDHEHQIAELKGQNSVLQQTHQIEVTHIKQKYEYQMQEMKLMFETERQRLQTKIKELQNVAEINRNLRQQYEELQQDSVQSQFQLRQALDEKQREFESKKMYIEELTRECESLTKKNSELCAGFVRLREEGIVNTQQAAEIQQKARDELQASLVKSLQLNTQKEKTILTLKQQLEKESKSNIIKFQHLQKQIQQLQLKIRNGQSQFSRSSQKAKESLEQSQKTVFSLNQQVAILTHKLTLQEQSLAFKTQSKSIELNKLSEKVKALEAKNNQNTTLSTNYLEQLRQSQQQNSRLKKILNIYFKEKQVALTNLEQQASRQKINERKYESHLNLFQEKLQETREENKQLKSRLQQYQQDYQNLSDMKINLQRTLEKQMVLSKNKLQMVCQQLKKQ